MNNIFVITLFIISKINLSQSFNFQNFLTPKSHVALDFSEDGYLTTSEHLDKLGYTNEKHYVTTPDGYILEIHRIRGRKGSPDIPESAPTVLMMPGLCVTDVKFVMNGPGKALGVTVADEGFDVWLGNWRGGRYGQNHTRLSTNDTRFWNFDIYEQSVIDIPAIVDYILEYVEKPQLHYIGTSFGGISVNYFLGLKPEYNDKIKALYYLAASMSLRNTASVTARILSTLLRPFEPLVPHLNIPVTVWSRESIDQLFDQLRNPVIFNLRYRFMESIFGPYNSQHNISRTSLYMTFQSSGCSISTFIEASQMVYNDLKLSDAGIGYLGNYAKYGTKYPPVVNLSLITPPKVFFYGTNDYITTKKDIIWTASKMSNVKKIIGMKDYNHLAGVENDDAKVVLIDPLVKQMRILDRK